MATDQLGTVYSVNFGIGYAPTTTTYSPEDGWERVVGYALKGTIEDLAGNIVNRTFAGKQIQYRGRMKVPAGAAPAAIKPGDSFSLTPVVNGVVTGTAVVYRVVSCQLSGNRLHSILDLTVVKEDSMTYT